MIYEYKGYNIQIFSWKGELICYRVYKNDEYVTGGALDCVLVSELETLKNDINYDIDELINK